MTTIHQFDSTTDAYDDVQCDDRIQDLDLLLIPDENIVGIALTWPIAVTRERGALHRLAAGMALESVAALMKCNTEDLQAAINAAIVLAKRLGYEIDPVAATLAV